MTDDKPEKRPFYGPGWYRDLSNDDYHGSFGMSSSSLKILNDQTPAHLKVEMSTPDESTAAKALGTAFHVLTLDPDDLPNQVVVMPSGLNLRTKADRKIRDDIYEMNPTKAIITAEQLEQAKAMAASVHAHPMASVLLAEGVAESSIYWWYRTMDTDEIAAGEDFKELVKVRPDWICADHPVIVDLKSTDDATYSGFIRTIQRFYYHFSAAMYLEGVNQCKPLLAEMRHMAYTNFVFVVTESEPPYLTAVYELSPEYLEIGKLLYRRSLRTLRHARANDWPGFPDDIRVLEPPPWASRGHVV